MTEREQEIVANAWALATGAQQILEALLIMLKKSGTSRELRLPGSREVDHQLGVRS
ncbi:hypothetical protein X736_20305 [Mesorhizobium sp. L2C089B000]|nr:hypothetical protein X767_04750 [Mesorhizobium sp. LSJC264A00]ESY24350.1 hypothetical protein X750_10115 [Mesorhizobium sp. LNJC394B00]ESZ04718.1 hypothetical protein X736_20305 [Mesorhizobium sp. L2C089B000]ESZ31957.1 hypothetical protein X733_20815 [Mesorhizobium sp. L2C067A000]ESZ76426.1 hypothetical protein X726_11495 [Mesorhizobium sp. L103C105A0]